MRHRSKLLITIAALGAAALIGPSPVQSTLTAGQRQEPSGRTTADPAAHWPRLSVRALSSPVKRVPYFSDSFVRVLI